MVGTYQHIQSLVLLLEGLSKLPNFTRFLHVDNMDVHLLTMSGWNPGCLPPVIFLHFDTTHRVPRFVDNNLSGLLCSILVPTHHVDSPTWKHKHTHTPLINEGCAAGSKPQPTLLGHSHGGRSADSTVGSSNHEGPSHHGHIQVLSVEIFRCCFISLPKRCRGEKTSKYFLNVTGG